MSDEEIQDPEVPRVALAFAGALAEGRYEAAYEMLAPSLRDDFRPPDLQDHYREMTGYWSAPADPVTAADVEVGVTEWPGKEANDIGWVYVSISSRTPEGGVNLEAVFVRVASVSGRNVIAQIEWGRP